MGAKRKVLLGMSGGVDSTVAALLLVEQGFEVIGATLRLQDEITERQGNALRDLDDAKAAADRLGIRHRVLDLRARFRTEVLADFAAAYDMGQTPNPCVTCNRTVKFPGLFAAAEEEGAQYVATGHYACTEPDKATGRIRLRRARNIRKDQSYVLYNLSQNMLRRILFPLGDYSKDEARARAKNADLGVSEKADSQDICFVPDGEYGTFLERFHGHPCPPGEFVDPSGRVLGPHKGIWHYTVGQRKGLGISLGAPAFVQSIDPSTRRITLGPDEALFATTLIAHTPRWIDFDTLAGPLTCEAKIRYAHPACPATVEPAADGAIRVTFSAPQRAITPGQAVVFYSGDYVLGGATIRA